MMKVPGSLLLVDDNPRQLRLMESRLQRRGYRVAGAAASARALAWLARNQPDCVLIGLKLPDGGPDLLRDVQRRWPHLAIVALTAPGDVAAAVHAIRCGAVDVLVKPVTDEQLIDCIERHRPPDAAGGLNAYCGIVSRSGQMKGLLDDARRAARVESPVLIIGASGTGKELLARAIHAASARAAKPFLAINCAALPADLLESELFGHCRGAFTGAYADHPGLFRAADGGTLLLDEIGDMPEALQGKLLRVLQEREVRPVGGTRSIAIDVRVLSATHRDLRAQVGRQAFREDLFYRLDVLSLRLPTLDERREDIPLLVAQRVAQLSAEGAPARHFSADAIDALAAARWPGNVRQLFNVVEQALALAPGPVISAEQVRRSLGESESVPRALDDACSDFIRDYLRRLLDLTEGRISRAARIAGRNRTDFYKLLGRHGINLADYKSASGE